MQDYRDLKYDINYIGIYFALTKKVKVISRMSKKYFSGKFLNIGCGVMSYKNLIF